VKLEFKETNHQKKSILAICKTLLLRHMGKMFFLW